MAEIADLKPWTFAHSIITNVFDINRDIMGGGKITRQELNGEIYRVLYISKSYLKLQYTEKHTVLDWIREGLPTVRICALNDISLPYMEIKKTEDLFSDSIIFAKNEKFEPMFEIIIDGNTAKLRNKPDVQMDQR